MKKGFTLIELLAVITILGLISLIAVPAVNKVLKDSKQRLYETQTKMIEDSARKWGIENINMLSETEKIFLSVQDLINGGFFEKSELINPKNNNIMNGCVIIKYDTDYSKYNYTYYDEECINLDVDTSGANTPELALGMKPIKWNGTEWEETTIDDKQWYNYEKKIWANAKTADGSMWVWIPRYIYKISSGWHQDETGTIEIKFCPEIDDTIGGTITIDRSSNSSTSNASNNNWTYHPAFTFGTDELKGIWVAKFSPSGTENAIDILPNKHIIDNFSVGSFFTISRNMETNNKYGWGTDGNGIDTHMAKAVEWGAVAYLTQSIYGKNSAVFPNNNSNLVSGCAGSILNAAEYNGCENTYDTDNGVKASTTGNVYGIYDMSGGAWEYVAAFSDSIATDSNLTTEAAALISDNSKYKDIYPITIDDELNNAQSAILKKGDALYETSKYSNDGEDYTTAWYNAYSVIAFSEQACYIRGGSYNTEAVGIFSYASAPCMAIESITFRPILVIHNNL